MNFLLPLALGATIALAVPMPEPVNVPEPVKLPNGCLVAAFEYECALSAKNHLNDVAWTRLLVARRGKDDHAFCAFALRNGDVWSYDVLHGSYNLNTRNRDIASIIAGIQRYDNSVGQGRFVD